MLLDEDEIDDVDALPLALAFAFDAFALELEAEKCTLASFRRLSLRYFLLYDPNRELDRSASYCIDADECCRDGCCSGCSCIAFGAYAFPVFGLAFAFACTSEAHFPTGQLSGFFMSMCGYPYAFEAVAYACTLGGDARCDVLLLTDVL